MTDEQNLEQLRAVAAHVTEQAVEGRRHLLEEHSASFRWLMASLMAINGAGLISVKDMTFAEARYALAAAASFFFGIVCALLIAYFGQNSNQKMVDPLSRIALYWRSVAISGELDEKIQKELDLRMSEATKHSKWPARVGFASLGFFTLGLASIGIGWMTK